MTLRSRLFGGFPALLLAVITAFFLNPDGFIRFVLVLLLVYGLPVLCFRLHGLIWPLREGLSRLDGAAYSPWWGGHCIQVVYDALPALEALLRLIPGAYSAWLRLWGSRVGRGVVWTPRVEITDRSLLEIGDRVIFGHKVACYPHVVSRKGGRLRLYTARIHIGADAFLGAGSRLGPGAVIAAGTVLPVLSDVGIGERRHGDNG